MADHDVSTLLKQLDTPVPPEPEFEDELLVLLLDELEGSHSAAPATRPRILAPAGGRRRFLVPAVAAAALILVAALIVTDGLTIPEQDRHVARPDGPAPAATSDGADAPPSGIDRRPVQPGIAPRTPDSAQQPSVTPPPARGEAPPVQGPVEPAPEPDRLALAVRGDDGFWHIHTMNADGTGLTQITFGDTHNREPAWSPDGKTIALMRYNDGEERPRPGAGIYLIDADGSNERLLVQGAEPAWSPDGARLAYTVADAASLTHALSIWVIDVDGSDARRVTPAGLATDATWSPKGDRLAFGGWFAHDPPDHLRVGSGVPNVYTMRLDGSPPQRLTNATYSCQSAFSPDGSRLAYVWSAASDRERLRRGGHPDAGPFHVWTMNADGTDQRQLTFGSANHSRPRWSPHGRQIVFNTDPDGDPHWTVNSVQAGPERSGVWVMNADGSEPKRLTPPHLDAADADFAPRHG